ncbi:hypothetical protein SO802_006877 [Lithocarpus litseifolius]|uniref:Uncharacterized protein n=1 Tax=Lithocarpus litseifolius TaxID=425828 RepID=A0AAW2DQK5_9ROSI
MKTQTDSIGKPRIIDHNEITTTPIEDNIDDDILVVEKPQVTPKPHVDKDVHASTCVALTCMQGNEGTHDAILEANESVFDQPSMAHKGNQFAKVEKVDNIVLPMVQDRIVLIPHIDFVIPEEFDMVEFKVFLFSMLPKVLTTSDFSTWCLLQVRPRC